MLYKLHAFIALALFTLATASGADNYFFDNYDTEQGLAHNHVLSIYQDSRGLIWVGTYGGVQAFNGYEFNQFNIVGKSHKKNILSNNVVHVIFEDSKGALWFGTENGLNYYNPINGKVKQYFTTNGLPSNNIRAICEDASGNLWIGSYNGGLSKLDNQTGKFQNFLVDTTQNSTLLSNIINTIYIDKANRIWIGSENGGISVFDINSEKVIFNITDLPDKGGKFTVNTFLQDDFSNIWVGTWDRGLLKYDNKNGKVKQYVKKQLSNSLCGNNVKSIIHREKNKLWISTYGGGISVLNIETEHFNKVQIDAENKESNTQDFIWSSYADADNNLWFGTYGAGLYRLNELKSTFPLHHIKFKGGKISISNIAQINTSEIWLGTMNNGLLKYDLNKKQIQESTHNSTLGSKIHSLIKDKANNLWIGKDALYMMDAEQKKLRKFSHNPELENAMPNSIVDHILEDRNGNIWLGFWEGGVSRISKKELEKPDHLVTFEVFSAIAPNAKLVGNITALWEDATGNIWIGTPEKVFIFNPLSNTCNRLTINVANSFYEDAYGNCWISTNGAGLVKVNKDLEVEKTYGFEDGFDCMDIQAMEVDERGRIWVSTSCGLSMLDLKTDIISNFGNNYGFKKHSNTLNASNKINELLLFGGGSILSLFDANQINKNMKATPAYVSDVKINNLSVAYENAGDSLISIPALMANIDTIYLNSKNKTLTLRFATVNFEIPYDIYYAYKMEGVNDDWIISEADNRTATYSNLKPGSYVFKIKNSYKLGQWNDDIKEFTIIVKPEYYQTFAFKLVIAIIIGALVLIFLKLLIRKNQLVLVLKQKTLFAEELSKEKEILDIKNEELQTTVDQYNNRIKALSLKYTALKENMTGLYKELLSSKLDDPKQSEQQLKQITDTIDEKITSLDSFSIGENIELDKDDFLVRFAQGYPKLSSNDLRICTLIRRNISNKDIAEQLNITSGSLEQSRYRMRKKMGLSSDVNLNELILRF